MIKEPLIHTKKEYLLAAGSHLFGFPGAFILWLTQKNKLRFASIQSIQAMAFNLLATTAVVLAISAMAIPVIPLLVFGITDIAAFGTQANPTAGSVRMLIAAMDAVPILIPGALIVLTAMVVSMQDIAALQTLRGKEFRYPLIGSPTHRLPSTWTIIQEIGA